MSTIYWQEELETLPHSRLEQLQFAKFKATIERAIRSPYYQKVFAENNLTLESFKSLEDIRKLPLTTKQDMRDNYPYGFMTESTDNIVRMHCTSGTTGNPVAVLYDRHDLQSWANMIARSMWATGVRPGDVFQNTSGYGLFTGGLGFQYGAELLGCMAIPAGAGNSKHHIKLMRDFGTTCTHAVASYMSRLYEVFVELGLDPQRDTKLRIMFIGAEPHSEETRQRIQQMFGCKAFNSFGMTEMNGPGVAFECEHQTGMHVWEDNYYLEIVDPQTMEPVPDGEWGEMILTTLDRHGMPLLRYRTRDLTRVIPGTCPCGRTARRIDRIRGRSDDMFIIKGCNVFPIQIERVLMQLPQLGNDYLITLDRKDGSDFMQLQCELKPDAFTDDYQQLEILKKRIASAVHDEVSVTPHVQLVPFNALPKSTGKAVRVNDLRKNY